MPRETMPHLRGFLAVALALGALGACTGDDHGDPSTYNCEADDRDEAFTAGMQKSGAGGLVFTLVSSTPAPPARDDNTWVVEVTNGGAPLDGVLKVTPFMPDHRHGTPIVPVITPVPGTPGRFTVAPVNLWMPGLWEITLEATPTGGTRDSAIFRFCITG